jgi:hypothetical protein
MKVRKQRSQGQFGIEKQSKNSSARGSIHEENMRIARDAGQDTRNWKMDKNSTETIDQSTNC